MSSLSSSPRKLPSSSSPAMSTPLSSLSSSLPHVVALIKAKQGALVIIAHDANTIKVVVFIPALCCKMGVPYTIVKAEARLGTVVHKKTSSGKVPSSPWSATTKAATVTTLLEAGGHNNNNGDVTSRCSGGSTEHAVPPHHNGRNEDPDLTCTPRRCGRYTDPCEHNNIRWGDNDRCSSEYDTGKHNNIRRDGNHECGSEYNNIEEGEDSVRNSEVFMVADCGWDSNDLQERGAASTATTADSISDSISDIEIESGKRRE